jgi:hypothetical protein
VVVKFILAYERNRIIINVLFCGGFGWTGPPRQRRKRVKFQRFFGVVVQKEKPVGLSDIKSVKVKKCRFGRVFVFFYSVVPFGDFFPYSIFAAVTEQSLHQRTQVSFVSEAMFDASAVILEIILQIS